MKVKIHLRDLSTELIVSLFYEYHHGTKCYSNRDAYKLLCNLYPNKLVNKKIYKLVDEGILNYGCSITSCWVEKKGYDFINPMYCFLFATSDLRRIYPLYERYEKYINYCKQKG